MGDYLEIWNSDAWQSEQTEIDEEYAELLENLADAVAASMPDEESS